MSEWTEKHEGCSSPVLERTHDREKTVKDERILKRTGRSLRVVCRMPSTAARDSRTRLCVCARVRSPREGGIDD
jgi:hypothetical protein